MLVVEHPRAVWRERSDATLALDCEGGKVREVLAVRNLAGDRFEVCCVPFFARDVALGDIVEATGSTFSRVLEASGRYVLRIFFEAHAVDRARGIIDEITDAGGAVELRGRLVAIDVRSQELAEGMGGRLLDYDRQGILHLETGRL